MKFSIMGTLLLLNFVSAKSDAGSLNCTGLRSDTGSVSMPSVAKPGYLQSYIDPVFGTKITRITGNPGTAIAGGGTWGTDVHHQYSKVQAFNADQSLLLIETNRDAGGTGTVFLDGNSYQPLFSRSCPGSDCRWHPTDPNKMIYVGGNSIGTWNPRTNVKTQTASFSGYSELDIGQYEGNLSLDGNRIAITGYNPSGNFIAFAYDMATKVKYPDISFYKWGAEPGNATISPKGGYIMVGYEEDSHNVVTDLNGNLIIKLPPAIPDHFDITVDQNGDEVAVGSGRDGYNNGRIVKVRLRDGAQTQLSFPGGYGSHTSTRGTAIQTWGVSNIFPDSSNYKNEIITYNLDGSKVYRLAHDHNPNPDYEAETHPMQSPDGLRIIFASDWGTGRPVSVYVIDLRDKCSGSASPTPTPGPTPTPPPSNVNLISNPGFEDRLAGWEIWANSTTVTGSVFQDARSLRSGRGEGGVYQNVSSKVSVGSTYTLSFAARLGSLSDRSAGIGIEFFNANGAVILDKVIYPDSSSYKSYSLDVTVPAGTVSALVYVYKNSGSSFVFADAFSLKAK